jgi:peptide/nickel transport system permease protein
VTSPCGCSTAAGTRSRSGSARAPLHVVAVLLALLAGYNGGWIDWVISVLRPDLGIPGLPAGDCALDRAGDQRLPPLRDLDRARQPLDPDARDLVRPDPLHRPAASRQILSLREKEFIEAAIGQGAGPLRVMFSDLLPNVASTILVFFTLIIATNILTEAGSRSSARACGARPVVGQPDRERPGPDPDGAVARADPGIAIVLTVLS